MANERRDAATIKRGSGRALIPIDGLRGAEYAAFDRTEPRASIGFTTGDGR